MLTGACHCGSIRWTFRGQPEGALSCNCTLCRRYGALWAYGVEGEEISFSGDPAAYRRAGNTPPGLEVLFCRACAAVAGWRGLAVDAEGRRSATVNLRLADPAAVAHLPLAKFDGLGSWSMVPDGGRCVGDAWF